MNTARPARRFAEAENGPVAMAEAIGDEVRERCVTRDLSAEPMALIRTEIQVVRTEMASMKADLQRTLIMTQIAGVVAIPVAVPLKG